MLQVVIKKYYLQVLSVFIDIFIHQIRCNMLFFIILKYEIWNILYISHMIRYE